MDKQCNSFLKTLESLHNVGNIEFWFHSKNKRGFTCFTVQMKDVYVFYQNGVFELYSLPDVGKDQFILSFSFSNVLQTFSIYECNYRQIL